MHTLWKICFRNNVHRDENHYPRQTKRVTAKRIECKENPNKHAQKGTCNCPSKHVFFFVGISSSNAVLASTAPTEGDCFTRCAQW